MKCFVKVGLYAVGFGLLVFTVCLPTVGTLLAQYGPEWCTKYVGSQRCLADGVMLSLVFLGCVTGFGAIASGISASEIECDGGEK